MWKVVGRRIEALAISTSTSQQFQELICACRMTEGGAEPRSYAGNGPADAELHWRKKHLYRKRRKCALLLSYNGRGYQGMKLLKPGTKTIERDLLEALAKANAFSPDMNLDLYKLQFTRSSQTDQGVSAAGQVVAIKMDPEQEVVDLANQFLPPQIRIMGLRRVTGSFKSSTYCNSVCYKYILPTYAFARFPLTTPLDYRIDNATRERVGQLLGMYKNGHYFHNFTSGRRLKDSLRYIISFTCGTPFLASQRNENKQEQQLGRKSEALLVEEKDSTEDSRLQIDSRKSGEIEKKVEFMTLEVESRSFMVDQIRNMVGLVIAIMSGFTPETTIAEALKDDIVDIPTAPALGLFLENVFFDRYNIKYGSDGYHDALDWEEYSERVEHFKRWHIYQSVIDTEITEMSYP